MISATSLQVRTHTGPGLDAEIERLTAFVARPETPLSRHPAWLTVLARGLGHTPYLLEAVDEGRTRGILPLAALRSLLFGRFLVSLPYLNYGGVLADDASVIAPLVDRAIALADELRVRFLELRHTEPIPSPGLVSRANDKVHMKLRLPGDATTLFKGFKDKVRNLIRKGQKSPLTIHWGHLDLLPEYYAVFSENMRDLGTPVYGRSLFASILEAFPEQAELCVVRLEGQPVAGAMLLHGWGVTEVPSASSLRRFKEVSPNMLMYWHLLERAVLRGQQVFDFGRSTPDGPTWRFKKQWGAEPEPTTWQYHVRRGNPTEMRPDNPKYQRMIRVWQKLPLWLANRLGPWIVRGIP